jgi:hypothetical protein
MLASGPVGATPQPELSTMRNKSLPPLPREDFLAYLQGQGVAAEEAEVLLRTLMLGIKGTSYQHHRFLLRFDHYRKTHGTPRPIAEVIQAFLETLAPSQAKSAATALRRAFPEQRSEIRPQSGRPPTPKAGLGQLNPDHSRRRDLRAVRTFFRRFLEAKNIALDRYEPYLRLGHRELARCPECGRLWKARLSPTERDRMDRDQEGMWLRPCDECHRGRPRTLPEAIKEDNRARVILEIEEQLGWPRDRAEATAIKAEREAAAIRRLIQKYGPRRRIVEKAKQKATALKVRRRVLGFALLRQGRRGPESYRNPSYRRRLGFSVWVTRAIRMRGFGLCRLCGLVMYGRRRIPRAGRRDAATGRNARTMSASGGSGAGRPRQRHRPCYLALIGHLETRLGRLPNARELAEHCGPHLGLRGPPPDRDLDRNWTFLVGLRSRRLTRRELLKSEGLSKKNPTLVPKGMKAFVRLMPGRASLTLSSDRHGNRLHGQKYLDRLVKLPDELDPQVTKGERDDLILYLHGIGMPDKDIARVTAAPIDRVRRLKPPVPPPPVFRAPFPTLREALPPWLSAMATSEVLSRQTCSSYRWIARTWIYDVVLPDGRILGDLTIDQVTREMFAAAIARVRAAGKPGLCDNVRSVFRKFYDQQLASGGLKGPDGSQLPNPAIRLSHEERSAVQRTSFGRSPEERQERARRMLMARWAGVSPEQRREQTRKGRERSKHTWALRSAEERHAFAMSGVQARQRKREGRRVPEQEGIPPGSA